MQTPSKSADDGPVARRVVAVLVAGLGVAAGLYALWFAFDDLLSGAGDPWFGLMVLAVVPVLLGVGVVLPQLIYAPDSAARTYAVAGPLWSACQAASMWMFAIAGGVYLAGWWPGAVLGGVVGGLFAWQGLHSMRWLRRTVPQDRTDSPSASERPTRREIVWLVARLLLFLIAFVVIAAGAGYAIFGRDGAVAATLIAVVGIVLVYALEIFRFRRRRSETV